MAGLLISLGHIRWLRLSCKYSLHRMLFVHMFTIISDVKTDFIHALWTSIKTTATQVYVRSCGLSPVRGHLSGIDWKTDIFRIKNNKRDVFFLLVGSHVTPHVLSPVQCFTCIIGPCYRCFKMPWFWQTLTHKGFDREMFYYQYVNFENVVKINFSVGVLTQCQKRVTINIIAIQ